jgi:hypothetical protein
LQHLDGGGNTGAALRRQAGGAFALRQRELTTHFNISSSGQRRRAQADRRFLRIFP